MDCTLLLKAALSSLTLTAFCCLQTTFTPAPPFVAFVDINS